MRSDGYGDLCNSRNAAQRNARLALVSAVRENCSLANKADKFGEQD